jgi:hypothetical protein
VTGRPFLLVFAAVLLLIIGLSGVGAGITITMAMIQGPDVPAPGIRIGLGITGYGLLAVVSGIGLLGRRRAFWWLAAATIGAGLAFLIGLIAITTLDPVFGTGLVIWGIALACLVAPATRAAVRG